MAATAVPAAPRTVTAVDPYANRYWIAFSVTLAAVLELIDTSIVNVAIPHMMGNLGATLDEIAWVSTGYIIANVIVIPMSSWLAGWFGRRRYLTISILIFVVSSFMCGASTGLWELVIWRVIQGLGGGALLSTAQATLFEAFPPDEVGMGQAIFGMGVMVGPTLGPTLGGWIIDNYDWPWIFYINVPLGLVAAALVWAFVRDSRLGHKATRVDGWGILFLAVGIGALQWLLERGERNDWFQSGFIVVLAVTSVVSLAAFIWRQLTFEQPIVNLRVLRSRQLATGVAMASVLGFALYGSVFVLPIFLQQLHGFTAWQTGQVIFPGAIASAVTMAVVGRNANRIDARYTIVAGSLVFFACMWQLSQLSPDAGADDVFWPLILRGFGLGLIFVPLTNASMADLGPRDVPQGTALFNLTRQLGGSVGIALLATLLTRFQLEARATLVTHLSSGDAAVTQRLDQLTRAMISRGGDPVAAAQQATAVRRACSPSRVST
ncbi:MAG: DHA2 family efflux MFS transporter permease subunit [Gemmatimonadaceae bacterium]|nr:DHA2 family efflux MFS transporter permease subunit [Gemmatimonadaceae bacterium]